VTSGAGAPTSTGSAGDTYINTTTGDTYTYNGTTWDPTGNIKGPAGPKGDTGTFEATATNGLNLATATNIQLGGPLITSTTITTSPGNTLAIAGLQTGAAADQIVVADPTTGVLKRVDRTTFAADVRLVGTDNHISQDAGVGANGTSMPGNDNIAIGKGAMNNASGGAGLFGNIAIGGGNQLANITSPGNVALGYGNLVLATTGNNVAVGGLNLTKATTASANYVLGSQNLGALISGGSNAVIGASNLNALTTGGNNQVFGSLNAITTQEQNIAIGSLVLPTAVGIKNIGVGSSTLTSLGTGQDNVGLGVASGGALTAGSYNTFFGTEAGNRIIGLAADRYTSGSNSLFLGSQTKAQNAVSNQLNIQNYIYGVNGSLAFGDFTGANPLIVPTARLDVTAGNVRVRGISALAGDVATDKVVVADGTGVLKTVTVASLANPPVTADNGLTKTLDIIQLGGLLTKTTTITANGNPLLFDSPERRIRFDSNGRIGSEAKGTNDGDIYVASGAGATYNRFDIQTFPTSGEVNLTATGAASQLAIATHLTTLPSPITFSTSPGGASGEERMRITGIGKIGMGTYTPSEQLDNAGITRLRILPLNGATNAINTTVDGDESSSQNQTFTATRTVVADANGVLGTLAGLATTVNIYNANGSLSGPRTVTTADNFLRFTGNSNTVSISNLGAQGRLSATGSNRGSIGIDGGSGASNSSLELYADASSLAQINASGTGSTGLSIGTTIATPMTFKTNGAHRMSLKSTGELVINSNGTIPPAIVTSNNPKLYVDGNIYSAGTIYTATNTYPDYVFEDYFNGFSKIYKDYKFKTLKEVAEFIKTNKHLPGITPISKLNVGENGYEVDLTKLSVQQLEKLEELYLHVIEMNDVLGQKDKEIKALQNKTNELEERLKKLESLLLKK